MRFHRCFLLFLALYAYCAMGASTITAVSLQPSQPISPTTISIDLTGATSSVTVAVDVTVDGGVTYRPIRAASAPISVTPGVTQLVVWDASKDVGFHSRNGTLRLTPADGGQAYYFSFVVPYADILRAAAHRVNHQMIDYGEYWDQGRTDILHSHQLAVVHPSHFQATRDVIQKLQAGYDAADPADDVIVLCYISIGEDLRTTKMDDAQFASDSRFRGNGQGPRVDPRPANNRNSLLNIDPLGAPSPGGTGWASFYLDDNSVANGGDGLGVPDRNKIFHGAFVNAGDPEWFRTLKDMRFDSWDNIFGMDEILLDSGAGRNLGCDGLFLDTVDTAAPDYYTDASSPNQSEFEWTAAGFRTFMMRLRQTYPDKLVLQNRGLFFFNPLLPHYQVTTRGYVDFVLLESFRLNSNGGYDPNFYPDNRWNYAPKLMAEANRPDGFHVLSLGYVAPPLTYDTLFNKSTNGYDTLIEDIRVTEDEVGMRHYLTSAGVDLANSFVLVHSNTTLRPDVTPPHWTSTFNPNPWPAQEPPARIGLQKAVSGIGKIDLYWDVAMDLNGVSYALYYQRLPFDWSSPNPLVNATRIVTNPVAPPDYVASWNTYAYMYTLKGLYLNVTYYLLVRAFDKSPAYNEESNTVTLSAMLIGDGTVTNPPNPTTAPPPTTRAQPSPPSSPAPPSPPSSPAPPTSQPPSQCGVVLAAENYTFVTPISTPFSYSFTALGGLPPYAFRLEDSNLPHSFILTNNTLSGTPASADYYRFLIVATDSRLCSSTPQPVTIRVTGGTGKDASSSLALPVFNALLLVCITIVYIL